MNRRAYLAALATGLTSHAGCLSTPDQSARDSAPTQRGSAPSSSHDWPTFGFDAANTGYNPATTGPGETAAIVWTAPTGTPTARASPVVAGDTVFASGTGDPGSILALDRADGTERWRVTPKGYTKAAPTVIEDTLYIGGWGQRFYALDIADGSARWHADFGHRFSRSSPTFVDGTIYVATIGGAPLTVQVGSDGPDATTAMLVALDATTGDERWRFDAFEANDGIEVTPAVGAGRVFCGSEEGRLFALETGTGDLLWDRVFTADGQRFAITSAPAYTDGIVYVGIVGQLFALDAASGEVAWRTDLRGSTVTSSPAVADGTVYIGCSGSRCPPEGCGEMGANAYTVAVVHAIDADDGEGVWVAEHRESRIQSSPAVTEDAVYIGLENGVLGLDRADGSTLWRIGFDGDGPVAYSSPAVSAGRVFIEAPAGRVYAIGEP